MDFYTDIVGLYSKGLVSARHSVDTQRISAGSPRIAWDTKEYNRIHRITREYQKGILDESFVLARFWLHIRLRKGKQIFLSFLEW